MSNEEFGVDEAQIGRVLHFVIERAGGVQCRPAFVVHDNPGAGQSGNINLAVFPDGSNDGKYGIDDHSHALNRIANVDGEIVDRTNMPNVNLSARWETSVHPNHAVKAYQTWHWPRECVKLDQAAEPFLDPIENRQIHHSHASGTTDHRSCYACQREASYQKAK